VSGVQVEQLTVLLQNLKAVCEPLGNDQHGTVFGAELSSVPAQKGGRAPAEVDRYIPNSATQTAHELHLGVRSALEVHTAHCADMRRPGVIDLDHTAGAEADRKLVIAKQSSEAAARIRSACRVGRRKAGESSLF
jgi:hypothetical protein